MKSAKNKEVQVIQETERGEIQPKAQGEPKQIRRIVPTMISTPPEIVTDKPEVKEPEEMKP